MALARVEQLNLGLSAGAVAASYMLVTPHFASSLAAGAFLEFGLRVARAAKEPDPRAVTRKGLQTW